MKGGNLRGKYCRMSSLEKKQFGPINYFMSSSDLTNTTKAPFPNVSISFQHTDSATGINERIFEFCFFRLDIIIILLSNYLVSFLLLSKVIPEFFCNFAFLIGA